MDASKLSLSKLRAKLRDLDDEVELGRLSEALSRDARDRKSVV